MSLRTYILTSPCFDRQIRITRCNGLFFSFFPHVHCYFDNVVGVEETERKDALKNLPGRISYKKDGRARRTFQWLRKRHYDRRYLTFNFKSRTYSNVQITMKITFLITYDTFWVILFCRRSSSGCLKPSKIRSSDYNILRGTA